MDEVKLLKEIVRINSTKNKEKEILIYLENLMEKKGFTLQRVGLVNERYNLLAIKEEPEIIFFSHIDTVVKANGWETDPFEPVMKKSKDGLALFGLGTVNMKGGLAASIAACSDLPNVGYCFTFDEEYNFEGIKSLIDSGKLKRFTPKLAIFCEPTDLKIVNYHRGCIELSTSAKGKSSHAARQHLGVDASRLYLALLDLEKSLKEDYNESCLNIGYFESGNIERINSVPDIAKAVIDIRAGNNLFANRKTEIKKRLMIFAKKYGLISIEVSENFAMPPLNTSKEFLKPLKEILEEAEIEFKLKEMDGCTEAGYVNQFYGIPAINFGPGPSNNSHQANEYVTLDSLKKTKEIYRAIALSFQ